MAMDQSILAKYDRPVPRYTSYPTAPHFHAGVDAAVYRGWLAELHPETPLSLYLHVPFCDTLCWFCGCHTRIVNRYAPVAGYHRTLLDEIDLVAGTFGGPRTVRHIHWGGGSPTILRPADILDLAARLRAHFTIAPDAEFAVEIDPRGVTAATVEALADAGVTRASIGVQDVNPAVQKAVNRIQPPEVTAAVAGMLRDAGIGRLNVDIMYGLPHQTVDGMRRTVESVLELAPGRIALFGYAHVPWMKKHQQQIDEAVLPGREERHALMVTTAETLVAAGYVWIGLDHFARPEDPLARAQAEGRLHRNFQGYTADPCPALIGLGASAIGALPDGYAQNDTQVRTWRAAVEAGTFPVARGIALDVDDRVRRAVIERLMCDLAVDVAAVARRFGRAPDTLAPAFAALAPLSRDGLCRIDGWTVTIPDDARVLMRAVAACFDKYLDTGAGRHSRAV